VTYRLQARTRTTAKRRQTVTPSRVKCDWLVIKLSETTTYIRSKASPPIDSVSNGNGATSPARRFIFCTTRNASLRVNYPAMTLQSHSNGIDRTCCSISTTTNKHCIRRRHVHWTSYAGKAACLLWISTQKHRVGFSSKNYMSVRQRIGLHVALRSR